MTVSFLLGDGPMNDRKSMSSLLDFIINTKYDSLPSDVRCQARKCFLDLAAVLCAGAKNNSSQKAACYVHGNFPQGSNTVLATGAKTNLIGASLANGMAANALDMDDGYSLLRGHPGAGFFGALLAAAEVSDCTYGEFLAALVISYEISIRQGYTIRDFYKWDHSSGCYSAFGTVAGAGRLLGLNAEELEHALGIADFIAPLNPAKRSCYVPSMNKDGIYYGQHAGMQAVMMSKAGITGRNPVILDDEYKSCIDTLGQRFYMFDLYVKFYSCCRWAHSPIRAISELMKKSRINVNDISAVNVYSFGNAGTLYRHPPACEDEAQYNIIYPLAAQMLFGDCGPLESSTNKMLDKRVPTVMDKIKFFHEEEYDRYFPAKRLSRVEIATSDGTVFKSGACEPPGDRNSDVTIDDLKKKAYKINGLYASDKKIETLVEDIIHLDEKASFSKILSDIKILAKANKRKDIIFI